MFLDGPRKLTFVDGYPERRVDTPHGAEGVGPQVLVADHHLGALVGVVGLFGVASVLHVDVGPAPRERVGVFVGQRIALPSAFVLALVEPVSLTGSVQRRGHHVPWVPDQEYHAALGQGLHEQGGPDRAVRLLDNEEVVGAEAGSCVLRAVEHEVPYGVDPTPTCRVGHDEVGTEEVRRLRPAVEVAEELAHHGLLPDQMPTLFSHHAPEPGAAAAPRAEDPEDVLRPYARAPTT